MFLAKCYALVHAVSDMNGVSTIWADQDTESQAVQIMQARDIIQNNALFNE